MILASADIPHVAEYSLSDLNLTCQLHKHYKHAQWVMLIMWHHMKYCMLRYDGLSFTVMTLNRFMYWYVIAVLIDVNATATWILLGHQWHNSAELHENVTVAEKETYAHCDAACTCSRNGFQKPSCIRNDQNC